MLEVKNLCKRYPAFELKNVSFSLPDGVIAGFIGQNGAGKTTTLKCIMRAVLPDSGEVLVNGKDMATHERENKQVISFTCGAFDYYRNCKLQKIVHTYSTFYDHWEENKFENYCEKFKLDLNKRVKELSAGMKVKFALALAMSHDAKIFIFDEPTSGLDPIARDELIDVFRDIVEDGDKSILFSTHITADLDKCADYVFFIKNGQIIVNSEKDALLESHVLIKGGLDQLTDDLRKRAIGVKTHSFGFTALIERTLLLPTEQFVTEKPTLDDVMVYYSKED